jgi:hypothetical protein
MPTTLYDRLGQTMLVLSDGDDIDAMAFAIAKAFTTEEDVANAYTDYLQCSALYAQAIARLRACPDAELEQAFNDYLAARLELYGHRD